MVRSRRCRDASVAAAGMMTPRLSGARKLAVMAPASRPLGPHFEPVPARGRAVVTFMNGAGADRDSVRGRNRPDLVSRAYGSSAPPRPHVWSRGAAYHAVPGGEDHVIFHMAGLQPTRGAPATLRDTASRSRTCSNSRNAAAETAAFGENRTVMGLYRRSRVARGDIPTRFDPASGCASGRGGGNRNVASAIHVQAAVQHTVGPLRAPLTIVRAGFRPGQ